jgi:hypothetical protein
MLLMPSSSASSLSTYISLIIHLPFEVANNSACLAASSGFSLIHRCKWTNLHIITWHVRQGGLQEQTEHVR